ncbi:hypothetical protein BCR34DRAFT_599489 [Clohesyomyces aquaticus]|uniref:Uncharacterized protein n=1 Tax=Clohesyomyces aquaticus TaxID=1231657 RepID=A0A1Y1ZUZ7_9PLEO|nr:hypothetical protein BCR34DRAFT_599489 [Clohesyomyces aquaticus]
MVKQKPMPFSSRLSEENMRIHDAAFPKSDGYFQVNLIREEQAWESEQEAYRLIFGDIGDLEDADFDMRDGEISLRRVASLEALKLYSGSFASCATPMSRFLTMSTTHDTHPWLARDAMNESGINHGDLETLELRKLASEMMTSEEAHKDTGAASMGSPRASSDTLSASRFREVRAARREGARTSQSVRVRACPRQENDKLGGLGLREKEPGR